MTEQEITKLLAKAKISIVKQEREAERHYIFERDGQTVASEIVYDFVLPNRHGASKGRVERDLYRIRFADGSLSDLGNLTRIKDAAITHANRILKAEA